MQWNFLAKGRGPNKVDRCLHTFIDRIALNFCWWAGGFGIKPHCHRFDIYIYDMMWYVESIPKYSSKTIDPLIIIYNYIVNQCSPTPRASCVSSCITSEDLDSYELFAGSSVLTSEFSLALNWAHVGTTGMNRQIDRWIINNNQRVR